MPLETVSSQADSAASIPLTCSRRKSGCSSCSGEEFLYCVKAVGYADGSAASGRACGLRPVPPYAAQHGNKGPQYRPMLLAHAAANQVDVVITNPMARQCNQTSTTQKRDR